MIKEVIGFLSRWVLLAVAVAGAVLIAWVTVRSLAPLRDASEVQVVVSDGIYGTWRRPVVYGYVEAPGETNTFQQFYSFKMGGRPHSAGGSGERIYVRAPRREPGLYRQVVRGYPHGNFALHGDAALVRIVADPDHVYAVDARLLGGKDAPDAGAAAFTPAAATELLKQLEDWGAVVIFHPGPGGAFTRDRPAVRDRLPLTREIPVVCAVRDEANPTASVGAIHHALTNRRGRPPTVITADRELAAWTHRRRYPTHVYDPGAGPGRNTDGAPRYSDLETLIRGLAVAEATREEP